MLEKLFLDDYKLTARVLQEKNILNTGFGSISLKTGNDTMLINKKNSCILEENFYISVNIANKTLAYKEANEDAPLHAKIYKNISFAKTALNLYMPNTIAYSIIHEKFQPIDTYGKKYFKNITIIEDLMTETNIKKLLAILEKEEIQFKSKKRDYNKQRYKRSFNKKFLL